MVLRRILTCRGRLPSAKRSYGAKWQTANQIAEMPLVFQSRGRATNSLWGRHCLMLCETLLAVELKRVYPFGGLWNKKDVVDVQN